MLDVVEADEPHVLGHRQTTLAQRLHGADRGHVVDRENRRRQAVERQDLLSGAIAADPVDGGANDELWLKGNAGRRERLAISAAAARARSTCPRRR